MTAVKKAALKVVQKVWLRADTTAVPTAKRSAVLMVSDLAAKTAASMANETVVKRAVKTVVTRAGALEELMAA